MMKEAGMSIKSLFREGTQENGTHRKFHHSEWRIIRGNKWGKENIKFLGDFGSLECIPCPKSADHLSQVTQDK
jgi:hypothetical protein